MLTLLIAIDGSRHAERAVEYAIARAAATRDGVRVHLVNVQLPLGGVNVKLFVSRESQEAYYREEGLTVLAAARERLAAAGIGHDHHIGVGQPGVVLVEYARAKRCDEIVMGTQGRGSLADAVLGSVARKVVQLASMPVVLVK